MLFVLMATAANEDIEDPLGEIFVSLSLRERLVWPWLGGLEGWVYGRVLDDVGEEGGSRRVVEGCVWEGGWKVRQSRE